jgi:hypothetical protein
MKFKQGQVVQRTAGSLIFFTIQARQALSEQLRISRELTETKTVESDSDEDQTNKGEDGTDIPENFKNFGLVGDSAENPWLLNDGKDKGNENEEAEGWFYFCLPNYNKTGVADTSFKLFL